jgi:hypothetical protein
MRIGVWVAVATIATTVWARPAAAQGVYVGGAVAAEVVRTSSTRSGGSTYDAGSGEAFAGAIRVGTNISERFGVELEYFRPGEIETDSGGPIYLAARDSPVSWATSTLFADPGFPLSSLTFPSIISQTTRSRASTTSALVVARQPLGSRIELAYLGGIGFSRVVREMEFGFPRGVFPLAPSILPASYTTRTTQYAVGPVAGVEVRAGMTEHAQVVAGVRLHALGQNVVDGWMIRPSIGLAWKF